MEKTEIVSTGASMSQDFDDYKGYLEQGLRFPTKIIMRCGEAIDYIALCYGDRVLPGHGNCSGGKYYEFPLLDNEHIIKISGLKSLYWNNYFLFSLKFHTDKGRVLGVDNNFKGINSENRFEINFKKDYALTCLFGKVASPHDVGQNGKNISQLFLSGIGAYQAKTHLSISDLNNRESVIFALREETPNDVFPVFDDFPFVNLYYKNNGNEYRRTQEYRNSLEIPSSENGEEYMTFGDYGAMYYVSKNISGNSYIGTVHYSGFLNLMFEPYLILPGATNFFQMCNARISHFNLEKEENVYQRLGYTDENLRKIFEESKASILASAPVSSVYIGGLSPMEAMKKTYSTMPEKYLHDIGDFINGLSFHKCLNKENWEEFLNKENLDFLFLGNVRIMSSAYFLDFSNLIYNVLKKTKENYSTQIAELPVENQDETIYDSIGDLLAAFYILTVTKNASGDFRSYLLPTAAYMMDADPHIDSVVGLKAFLDDIYHVHNGFHPVFVFKNKEGQMRAVTLESDLCHLMEEGFYFFSLLGYYPEKIVMNAEKIFHEDKILDLAYTYGTFNRGTLIPLFNLHQPTVNDSFLTFDLNEVIESRKLGYEYEGCLGYVVSPDVKNGMDLKPIYRAHNSKLIDHFFTKSKEEIDYAKRLGYTPENVTGYECDTDKAVKDGTCQYYKIEKRQIYRYYSASLGNHRYTLSDKKTERERDYKFEGESFSVAVFTPERPE